MKRVLAALLFAAVLIPAGVRPSGATFVAATANPNTTFSAAADFNTVAVTLTDPGSPLSGSVSLSANAASNRGIASVVFASAPAGTSTWTTACTDTVAPYSCTFDTTAVADGLRDVRALATDTAGYTRADVVANRRVDNTGPTVSTTDPGSPLTGTTNVTSTATDAGSGLASVTLQYRLGAGAWTTICTTASSPSTCAWNTASLADGLYDLHTLATDAVGNSTTSAQVSNRRVDNTAPSATLTAPAATLAGTITLQSTTADGSGSGVANVRYEYKPSAGGSWTTACTGASTPFSCLFNTATAADGLYDFRAVATDGVALSATSAAVTSRRIDNTAPIGVTLGPVAAQVQGTVALAATAADAGSGVASVRFQYAPAGTSTWTDICTDPSSPYTCSFDTTTAPDALYDMRALATDNAGNTTASTVQANRRVDNNGPTVALVDPGSSVSGTISLSGTATDPGGVLTTTFEYRPTGAAAWTTLCTDTTAPYTCPGLDTTLVPDGSYDLRMQATDNYAHTSISAVLTVQVDNTAPTAVDAQGANGGTAGTIDALDTLTLTFSEPMLPASIMAGWNGSSTAVQVRVNDVGANDTLDVYDAAGTTKLKLTSATQALQLRADWVSATASFNATLVRSGSQIVVTFGTRISGAVRTGVATTANMIWTPSTAATDLAGNPASATACTETGALDRDF